MPFTDDFSAFRASVSTWLDWSDSTTTKLNDLIIVGENKVHKTLRVREMESALATTCNSSGQAALPSDFIELIHAYIQGSPVVPLERISLEQMYRLFPNRTATTGTNRAYIAREGSNFILGNAGSSGDVVKGRYFAKPTSMPGASTITSVFSAHPECYLFAALSEAEPFIGRDARLAIWESKFSQCVNASNEEYDDADKSGSTLAATLG